MTCLCRPGHCNCQPGVLDRRSVGADTTVYEERMSCITGAGQAQVAWPRLWAIYRGKCDQCARDGQAACQSNSLYDLMSEVARVDPDVTPFLAMKRARAMWMDLEDGDKDAAAFKKWRWSPQCAKAVNLLAERHGDDPVAAEEDVERGDLLRTWAAGWRWCPFPCPESKSHAHRFYPPTHELKDVAKWEQERRRQDAKKKAGAEPVSQLQCTLRRGAKGAHDAGCVYLTTCDLRAYMGAELLRAGGGGHAVCKQCASVKCMCKSTAPTQVLSAEAMRRSASLPGADGAVSVECRGGEHERTCSGCANLILMDKGAITCLNEDCNWKKHNGQRATFCVSCVNTKWLPAGLTFSLTRDDVRLSTDHLNRPTGPAVDALLAKYHNVCPTCIYDAIAALKLDRQADRIARYCTRLADRPHPPPTLRRDLSDSEQLTYTTSRAADVGPLLGCVVPEHGIAGHCIDTLIPEADRSREAREAMDRYAEGHDFPRPPDQVYFAKGPELHALDNQCNPEHTRFDRRVWKRHITVGTMVDIVERGGTKGKQGVVTEMRPGKGSGWWTVDLCDGERDAPSPGIRQQSTLTALHVDQLTAARNPAAATIARREEYAQVFGIGCSNPLVLPETLGPFDADKAPLLPGYIMVAAVSTMEFRGFNEIRALVVRKSNRPNCSGNLDGALRQQAGIRHDHNSLCGPAFARFCAHPGLQARSCHPRTAYQVCKNGKTAYFSAKRPQRDAAAFKKLDAGDPEADDPFVSGQQVEDALRGFNDLPHVRKRQKLRLRVRLRGASIILGLPLRDASNSDPLDVAALLTALRAHFETYTLPDFGTDADARCEADRTMWPLTPLCVALQLPIDTCKRPREAIRVPWQNILPLVDQYHAIMKELASCAPALEINRFCFESNVAFTRGEIARSNPPAKDAFLASVQATCDVRYGSSGVADECTGVLQQAMDQFDEFAERVHKHVRNVTGFTGDLVPLECMKVAHVQSALHYDCKHAARKQAAKDARWACAFGAPDVTAEKWRKVAGNKGTRFEQCVAMANYLNMLDAHTIANHVMPGTGLNCNLRWRATAHANTTLREGWYPGLTEADKASLANKPSELRLTVQVLLCPSSDQLHGASCKTPETIMRQAASDLDIHRHIHDPPAGHPPGSISLDVATSVSQSRKCYSGHGAWRGLASATSKASADGTTCPAREMEGEQWTGDKLPPTLPPADLGMDHGPTFGEICAATRGEQVGSSKRPLKRPFDPDAAQDGGRRPRHHGPPRQPKPPSDRHLKEQAAQCESWAQAYPAALEYEARGVECRRGIEGPSFGREGADAPGAGQRFADFCGTRSWRKPNAPASREPHAYTKARGEAQDQGDAVLQRVLAPRMSRVQRTGSAGPVVDVRKVEAQVQRVMVRALDDFGDAHEARALARGDPTKAMAEEGLDAKALTAAAVHEAQCQEEDAEWTPSEARPHQPCLLAGCWTCWTSNPANVLARWL